MHRNSTGARGQLLRKSWIAYHLHIPAMVAVAQARMFLGNVMGQNVFSLSNVTRYVGGLNSIHYLFFTNVLFAGVYSVGVRNYP